MLFREAVELYLKTYSDVHHAPKTREGFLEAVKPFEALHGNRPVDTINMALVEDYQRHAAKEVGLSPATVNKHLRFLRAFFFWLMKRELLAKNPAVGVRALRVIRRRKPIASDKEILLFLDYLDRMNETLLADMLRLAWNLGARRGEVVYLRHKDVDLERGYVTLRCHDDHVLKDREERIIPLNGVATEILSRRMRFTKGDDLLFTRKPGTPLIETSLNHSLKRHAERAGLDRIGFQQLRHAFATKNATHMPEGALAALLGHAKPETTRKHYEHAAEMDLPRPVEKGGKAGQPGQPIRPSPSAQPPTIEAPAETTVSPWRRRASRAPAEELTWPQITRRYQLEYGAFHHGDKTFYLSRAALQAFGNLSAALLGVERKDMRLHAVTPEHVEAFRDSILKSVHAVRTARNYMKAVRAFFRWCVRTGNLAQDPAESVVIFEPTRKRIPIADEEQIRKLLSHLEGTRGPWPQQQAAVERLADFVRLIAFCGLRFQDVVSIRLRDIDYAGRRVLVHATSTARTRSKGRHVPVTSSEAWQVIELRAADLSPREESDWDLLRHAQDRADAILDQQLFSGARNTKKYLTSQCGLLSKHVRKLGLSAITWTSLRNFFISNAAKETPPEKLVEILGLESPLDLEPFYQPAPAEAEDRPASARTMATG